MGFLSEYNDKFLEATKNNKPAPMPDEKYGIEIEHVANPEQAHWRIIGVHHLTGPENGGKHHLFCDVLDKGGQRIMGAHLILTNGNLPPSLIAIDKPLNEPGTNIPMFFNDTISLIVNHPDSDPLPSERISEVNTRHPDEEPGTTLGHHSFYVVFQETDGGPPPNLEDYLWKIGEPLIVLPNQNAKFFKFAQDKNLGQQWSREYVVTYEGKNFLAQIYEKGLVFAQVGHFDQIQIIPHP